MKTRKENVGTSLMVLQEQYNHQKRLQQIYQQPSRSMMQLLKTMERIDTFKQNKKACQGRESSFMKEQHLKNITRLLYSITKDKTNSQRLKDPHDFIAYPPLFFRNVATSTPVKKKKKRTKVRLASQSEIPQQESNFPSIEKIKQSLPILTTFEQQQLEEWADAVSKLIINYNITNNKTELLAFAAKVISVLPKKCPREFKQAA